MMSSTRDCSTLLWKLDVTSVTKSNDKISTISEKSDRLMIENVEYEVFLNSQLDNIKQLLNNVNKSNIVKTC